MPNCMPKHYMTMTIKFGLIFNGLLSSDQQFHIEKKKKTSRKKTLFQNINNTKSYLAEQMFALNSFIGAIAPLKLPI